jgi:hypothetical protein
MPKTRRGLLVTLVLVSVAVAAAWFNHDVIAGTSFSGSAPAGPQFVKTTATLEGEPDVGQIHQQPSSNRGSPITDQPKESRSRISTWLRLVREVWMVRYLGPRFYFIL